ncbi:hypothetical protein O7606_01865 [Micromonospora sp. WMMD882]|uniref:hypothetical protein n=1 Tax=Micromonospora sp. WMMD882 TaxID=3015151 RepID=UPI00248B3064|nr:hypothetical protein [Micromonospora sp. WMMD882]WBB80162.1 hypothetical protein O7606_01865 [Micromonospora sp. WMMD882]
MTTDGETGGRRGRLDWRGRLSGVFLGAAGGMGVNVLSNDARYQGVVVAAVAGGVLSAAAWLRRLPPRAPLARHTARVLLALALVGAVVAALAPGVAARVAALATTALTVTAVLVASDLQVAGRVLAGAACVGLGVSCVAIAVDSGAGHRLLFYAVLVIPGVTLVGLGVEMLLGRPAPGQVNYFRGVSHLVVGAIVVGLGLLGVLVALVMDGPPGDLFAMTAMSVLGVAYLGLGAGTLLRLDVLRAVAYLGIGGSVAALAVAVVEGDPLVQTLLGCLGLAAVGLGVAALRGSEALRGLSYLVLGVTLLGFGVVRVSDGLRDEEYLPLLTLGGLGVAVLGHGMVTLRDSAAVVSARSWLGGLTRDPVGTTGAPTAAEPVTTPPRAAP